MHLGSLADLDDVINCAGLDFDRLSGFHLARGRRLPMPTLNLYIINNSYLQIYLLTYLFESRSTVQCATEPAREQALIKSPHNEGTMMILPWSWSDQEEILCEVVKDLSCIIFGVDLDENF